MAVLFHCCLYKELQDQRVSFQSLILYPKGVDWETEDNKGNLITKWQHQQFRNLGKKERDSCMPRGVCRG